MKRGDVEITREVVKGKDTRVLRVYVDAACKNDMRGKDMRD